MGKRTLLRTRQVVVRHLAAKLEGCESTLINDLDYVCGVLNDVTEKIGMTYLGRSIHRFAPHGVSVVFLLAESHISVHTWPECGLADIEIVSCNPHSDVRLGLRIVEAAFKASATTSRTWTFKHDY